MARRLRADGGCRRQRRGWRCTHGPTHDGDAYVLNGSKAFITNAGDADLYIVMARTGQGTRGVSAFLVEASWPGVSAGAPLAQDGAARFVDGGAGARRRARSGSEPPRRRGRSDSPSRCPRWTAAVWASPRRRSASRRGRSTQRCSIGATAAISSDRRRPHDARRHGDAHRRGATADPPRGRDGGRGTNASPSTHRSRSCTPPTRASRSRSPRSISARPNRAPTITRRRCASATRRRARSTRAPIRSSAS